MDANKASFQFARLQYMVYLRSTGKTNAQISRAVGISQASVVKILGYQPEKINKVSFSKRGKKAAATRAANKAQQVTLARKRDIELINAKINQLKAEKAVKIKTLTA